jgi:hypothetical protein
MNELEKILNNDNNVNPLEILAIEPWFLRTLTIPQVKHFLKNWKKTVAIYHHPDKYLAKSQEQATHEAYNKRITNEIDRLLEDEYTLREAIKDLPVGGPTAQVKNENNRLKRSLKVQVDKYSEIEHRLVEQVTKYETVLSAQARLRQTEQALSLEENSIPLVRNTKRNIFWVRYNTAHAKTEETITQLIQSSGLQDYSLEITARNAVRKSIQTAEQEKKKKEQIQFRSQIKGNRVKIFRKMPDEEEDKITHKGEIIGSLLYSAIREYVQANSFVLTEGFTSFQRDPHDTTLFSLVYGTDQKKEGTVDTLINQLRPYTSSTIFPYAPTLIKEAHTSKNKEYATLHLWIPCF